MLFYLLAALACFKSQPPENVSVEMTVCRKVGTIQAQTFSVDAAQRAMNLSLADSPKLQALDPVWGDQDLVTRTFAQCLAEPGCKLTYIDQYRLVTGEVMDYWIFDPIAPVELLLGTVTADLVSCSP